MPCITIARWVFPVRPGAAMSTIPDGGKTCHCFPETNSERREAVLAAKAMKLINN
jgi:hypothetical protein